MTGSYCGRYLDIDLSSGAVMTGEPDPELLRKFIGGKGLGLALLSKLDAGSDPFGPGNPLIFLTGPLTGTSITTSNRSCVVTRSPLTGGFLDSHAGGHYGTMMKRAGYDYIIIRGRSDRPAYLHITGDGAEIIDATGLWGKGCVDTENALRGKHPNAKVASIGPAGENMVRFACITTELWRQYGRGGAGAVMGSKMLKAVVIEGDGKTGYADEKGFRELSQAMTKDVMKHPNRQKRFDLGTVMWVRMGQEQGRFLPTHNFRDGQFSRYEGITSEAMKENLGGWKSTGCHNCVILCSKWAEWDGKRFEGPEYETTAFLGSGCEIGDAESVAEANYMCDDLGLDTISTGVVCSFAMEAAEKGLLDAPDNDWIKFGDALAQQRLIRAIAFREGIGDTLAEGTRLASRAIGKGSDYFAIQVGGMELSGVNPLGSYSMALALTTADFASHTRLWSASDEMAGNLTLDGLPEYCAKGHDEINIRNSLIVCDFLMFGLDRLAPMVSAATGFEMGADDLLEVGTRIHHLARAYNMKKGRTHADDVLPGRFYEETMFAGLLEGKKLDRRFFERQLQDYFALRGWDKDGRPTGATLERYGLAGFV